MDDRARARDRWSALTVPAVISFVVLFLTGCWSVRPGDYIEFGTPIDAERSILAEGVAVQTEAGNDRLVASALLPDGATALYYADRRLAGDPDLTAEDVRRVVLIPAQNDAARSLAAMETCDDALLFFPILQDYREEHVGYEEPDEGWYDEDAERALSWRFSVSLVSGFGAARPRRSVTVEFRAVGSTERGTRTVFVFVRPEDGDAIRFTIPRSAFDIEERLSPRVQRMLRSIAWDGRVVYVAGRRVDTDSGEIVALYERAPHSYIDHIAVAGNERGGIGDGAALIYGSRRVTKAMVVVPFTE